jgi:hypothetical protein
MKPKEWNKFSEKEKEFIATELLNSIRGRFILSQALTIAVEQMKKVPKPYTEISNIQDMEILREVFFSLYPKELMDTDKFRKLLKKVRK